MAENESKQPEVSKAVSKPAEKKSKKPFAARIVKWFRELKSEVKKIVWPTPKQTINNTLVVICMVFVVGAVIWLADAGLQVGISYLLIS